MNSDLLMSHAWALQNKYAGLRLHQNAGVYLISGNLHFEAIYNGVSIEDEYEIEIDIPDDYPDRVPLARETAGKIPKDFHTNPDGALCLSSPLEIKMKFGWHKTLLSFVENLLIPFLYSCSFKLKYGKMPFGELPHGTEGIIENYMSLFCVRDCRQVLGLLRLLCVSEPQPDILCPCGSKALLNKCHGRRIEYLRKYQSADELLKDTIEIIKHMVEKT